MSHWFPTIMHRRRKRGGGGQDNLREGGGNISFGPPPNNPPTCTGNTIPVNSILEFSITSYFKISPGAEICSYARKHFRSP